MSNETQQSKARWVRNKVLAEYLGVTVMSLWRWQRDPDLNFPQPSYIKSIPYNNLDEVDRWMRARAVNLMRQRDAVREVA